MHLYLSCPGNEFNVDSQAPRGDCSECRWRQTSEPLNWAASPVHTAGREPSCVIPIGTRFPELAGVAARIANLAPRRQLRPPIAASADSHQPISSHRGRQVCTANICAICASRYGPSSRPESFSEYAFTVASRYDSFRSDAISANLSLARVRRQKNH